MENPIRTYVGGTVDNPPPGEPGDEWMPEGSEHMQMNDAGTWIPDGKSLASLYGVCTTCGAHRTLTPDTQEMSPRGQVSVRYLLVCSENLNHTQDMP